VAKDSKQGNGTKIALAIAGIVIVALVAVVVVLLVRGKKDENEPKRNVVVTQDNAEEIAQGLIDEPYIEPGYYNTNMSTTWHFSDGDAVSDDAYVRNDERNTHDVYFDVYLADDESTPILESPVLPRGSSLENISLDKPLDAGTYDCVMVYHLVDDNQSSVASLRVAFTIIIEQ
jgi:hypothetical protein